MVSIKSRIEYQIKFNAIANRIYTNMASFGVTLLGIGRPVRNDLILFVSDIGKNYTGSPAALYEYMVEQNLLDNKEAVWAFERPEEYSNLGCRVVRIDTVEYFRIAMQARYWVSDVNIERGLRFKRQETTYLNTWHGTSFKTLGWDIHKRIYYDCSSIDIMCVNSEYDIQTFSRAFRMVPNIFIRSGLPRNDQLYIHSNESSIEWKKRVGLPTDKRVILYAPTWRDSTDGGETYSINPPINIDKWYKRLGEDWVLVLRTHPLTQDTVFMQSNGFLYDYSKYQPLNDLLLATDVLISDYSSISIDYAILKRPVLCFGYDIDDYAKTRGLYLDLSKIFPYGNCSTEDELIKQLGYLDKWGEREYTAPIYTEFNSYGGDACSQCCKSLFMGKG